MRTISLAILCFALTAPLGGCKIVRKVEGADAVVAADASGDDSRTEDRLTATFDSQLIPLVRDSAIPVADLRAAIASGLDAAGAAHGRKGSGEGAAWNFSVSGEGRVIDAKLDTGARTATVDTDGDGAGDVVLQLGPVVRGTALRDVAPFYNFDDFRDQLEFAKLARAINDRIKATYIVPEGSLVGLGVSFVGVVALKSADEQLLVTPISLEFGQ